MMRLVWLVVSRCLVLAQACLLLSCAKPATELDLLAYDRNQDQNKIAEFYSQEAARLRLTARDLEHRAVVYERLFGSSSDWVEGTRLLAQSYDDAARDHERTAEEHLAVIHRGRASTSGWSKPR